MVRRRQEYPSVTDAEMRDRLEIEIGRMLAMGKYPSSYSILEAAGFSTRNDRARKMLDELLDVTPMPAEFVERRQRNKAVDRSKTREARRSPSGINDPSEIERRLKALQETRLRLNRDLQRDEFEAVLDWVERHPAKAVMA